MPDIPEWSMPSFSVECPKRRKLMLWNEVCRYWLPLPDVCLICSRKAVFHWRGWSICIGWGRPYAWYGLHTRYQESIETDSCPATDFVFSATMPSEIEKLADSMLTNPEKIEVTPVSSTVDTIRQSVYFVEKKEKKDLLLHLLKNPEIESVLILPVPSMVRINWRGFWTRVRSGRKLFMETNRRTHAKGRWQTSRIIPQECW